jgi:hypothetical protein
MESDKTRTKKKQFMEIWDLTKLLLPTLFSKLN